MNKLTKEEVFSELRRMLDLIIEKQDELISEIDVLIKIEKLKEIQMIQKKTRETAHIYNEKVKEDKEYERAVNQRG